MPHRYRRFHAADEPAFAALEGTAFAVPEGDVSGWLDTAGRDQLRVLEVDGAVAGGLVLVPMGLFVAGRSLPTWGVAGVAVPPERRGRGLARALMASMLLEARQAGAALSSLFASTRTLYRSVGYGVAGSLRRVELPSDALRARGGDPSGWRRATEADHAAVEACYRRRAQASNGLLDRGPYVWSRLRQGATTGTWVREREGAVVAYVCLVHSRSGGPTAWSRIGGLDWAADTEADLRSVVAFVAGFRSMARTTSMAVQVDDPLLDVLDEARWSTVLEEGHLVRILDVPAALEGRGYDPSIRGRVVLDVVDGTLTENAGPWTLEVEGGQGRVVRGGQDGVPVDVRGLAALLTGYTTPATLVRRGLLARAEPSLGVFAAPTPSCLDFY